MGLDMYAFTVKSSAKNKPVDQKLPEERDELFYWRKHPNLHGWMQRLYENKGGTDRDFNGATVQLTLQDLFALEQDVKNNKLPMTSGFFFGQSQPEDAKYDLQFIAKARQAIASGYDVYYDSWW